ncbi:MAG TPA: NIPSNAP family protein [Planctomycetaceae bacterium]|nr:NIPSNAP family protein [Planctomycetaceae bacterium]
MSRQAAFVLCAGLCGLVGLGSFTAGYSVAEHKAPARLYELRTYTTHPGRLPALHARFRDHTMKLFEKHGMKNGMYWVPTDEKLKDNTLIYVVSHASEDAAKASWDAFIKDPEWIAARDASEKDGKIVQKVEKVYMRPTEYSPSGN